MGDGNFILELIPSNKEDLIDDVELKETQIFLIIFVKHEKWGDEKFKKGEGKDLPGFRKEKSYMLITIDLTSNPRLKK